MGVQTQPSKIRISLGGSAFCVHWLNTNDNMSLVVGKETEAVADKIHIGHTIRTVLEESGMSITEFAQRLNCTRPNAYDIFERCDIGVEQLIEISKVLGHNFFDDIQASIDLDSQLQVRRFDIHINIETISADKAKQISELVGRLGEIMP